METADCKKITCTLEAKGLLKKKQLIENVLSTYFIANENQNFEKNLLLFLAFLGTVACQKHLAN